MCHLCTRSEPSNFLDVFFGRGASRSVVGLRMAMQASQGTLWHGDLTEDDSKRSESVDRALAGDLSGRKSRV